MPLGRDAHRGSMGGQRLVVAPEAVPRAARYDGGQARRCGDR